MRRKIWKTAALLGLASAVAFIHTPLLAENSGNLRIAVVDVEGGAAVLFVTPEGKSLLIDAGWAPGRGGRPATTGGAPSAPPTSSAERIAAAAASLGIKRFDYLMMTHYHADHVGGVESLLKRVPADTFIDHGPNREQLPPNPDPRELAIAPVMLYPFWAAAIDGRPRISAKAGQILRIGTLQVQFVSSDGAVLDGPLPGAGAPNPLCAGVPKMDADGGEENVRSLGVLITFGKTRILDLGDLTWNKEMELLCPTNKIGKVDLYFVTGHGMDISSSPPTAALDPLVAVMENGPTKGSDEAVVKTIHTYPDLEGLWRAHASRKTPELNGDPNYLANLDQQPDHAYPIDIEITPAGKITVTNERNQFSKIYTSRDAQASARH